MGAVDREREDLPVLLVPVPRPMKKPTTRTAASGAWACSAHPRDVAASKNVLIVSWPSKTRKQRGAVWYEHSQGKWEQAA